MAVFPFDSFINISNVKDNGGFKEIDWELYTGSNQDDILDDIGTAGGFIPRSSCAPTANTSCVKNDTFSSCVFNNLDSLFTSLTSAFISISNDPGSTASISSTSACTISGVESVSLLEIGWLDVNNTHTEVQKLHNFILGSYRNIRLAGTIRYTVTPSYFISGSEKVVLVEHIPGLPFNASSDQYIYFYTHLANDCEYGQYFITYGEPISTTIHTHVYPRPISTGTPEIQYIVNKNLGIQMAVNIFNKNICKSSGICNVEFNDNTSAFWISKNAYEGSKQYSTQKAFYDPTSLLYIVKSDLIPPPIVPDDDQLDIPIFLEEEPEPANYTWLIVVLILLIVIFIIIIGTTLYIKSRRSPPPRHTHSPAFQLRQPPGNFGTFNY